MDESQSTDGSSREDESTDAERDAQTEETSEETTREEVEETEEEFDQDRALALITKLRQEAKSLKKRAKIADALEKADKERRDAELSETERLTKELDEAKTTLARMEREQMQQAAAKAAGLPLAMAPRLTGENEDELLADAKALKKLVPSEEEKPEDKKRKPKIAPGQPPTSDGEKRVEPIIDMGSADDIFDPSAAADRGGGVIWSPSTETRMNKKE